MTSYGTVQIGNRTYIEREDTVPLEVTVNASNVIRGSVQLPGVSDFWLKILMRDVVAAGVSVARRFKFRLGNSDGATWYQNGGVGGTTDRVIDTLLFGNAQFPFVINPYIYYGASASIQYEIEDISGNFPYTIYFGFRGTYLLPA